MVEDIDTTEIDRIEEELSKSWQRFDKGDRQIEAFFNDMKSKYHGIINIMSRKNKVVVRDFVPYPGGAAISWNSSGHLAVLNNPKIR